MRSGPVLLVDRPERALGVLCVAQLVVWTLAPLLTHSAPPLDVVEMYAWGREGVAATYKHPNLPGLVLELTRRATSGSIWPTYLVSQFFVVATFVAVFCLGRDLMNARSALVGVLLLTGIFYYSWPTPEMNHNIAQLPLWALTVLALWRGVERGQIFWWIVLGVAAGVTMWAKYSAVVLLLVALGWLLVEPRARRTLRTPGPWLGLIVFLIVVSPQVRYLFQSDFLPLAYASARSSGAAADPWWSFVLAQLAAHGVMLLMLAAALLLPRRTMTAAADLPDQARGTDAGPRARRYLEVMALGPLILLVAGAVITGAGLKDMWGTPMFNLSGLLAVMWLAPQLSSVAGERIARFAAALLIVVPVAYAGQVAFRPFIKDKPHRVNWPQADIAASLTAEFETRTGKPLRIVAGPIWEAGLVALTPRTRPSVAIDGSTLHAPWVSDEDYAAFGFLAVWPARQSPHPELARRIAGRTVFIRTFHWSTRPGAREIKLSYVVVPPVSP